MSQESESGSISKLLPSSVSAGDSRAATGSPEPMADLVGGIILRVFTWLEAFYCWSRKAKWMGGRSKGVYADWSSVGRISRDVSKRSRASALDSARDARDD